MENVKESIAKCKQNDYGWTNNWWYFPYETNFLNEMNFKKAQTMNKMEISKYVYGNLNKDIWFSTFIRLSALDKSESSRLLKEYEEYLFTDFKKITHEAFLIRYFSTLDIYGLGITFLQILHYTRKYMNETFNTSMKVLAMKMISFNPNRRILITHCISEFEKIIETSGFILHNKTHKN